MLVLAASASFLLALLPVYAQAQEKAGEKITEQAQEIAFNEIVSQAQYANTLGRNALLTTEVFLAVQTRFSFDSQTREFRMHYEIAGEKNKTLAEKTSFDAIVSNEVFSRGRHEVSVSNQGTIEIGIMPASRQEK